MQENHSNNSDDETKYSFPTNDLERLQSIILKNPFLHDELSCGENLSASNKEDTNNCADSGGSSGCIGLLFIDRYGLFLAFFEEGTGKTNNSHTKDNNEESEPLEGTEVTLKEEHAEDTNKEDEGSTGHLVDFELS